MSGQLSLETVAMVIELEMEALCNTEALDTSSLLLTPRLSHFPHDSVL